MKKKSCITMIYYMDGRDATVYVGMGGRSVSCHMCHGGVGLNGRSGNISELLNGPILSGCLVEYIE